MKYDYNPSIPCKNEMDYSPKELQLIRHYGYENLLDMPPPVLYRIMVEKAFDMDDHGPYADSLRRCHVAMSTCKIYRRTPEWEALINLEPEKA